MECVDTPGPDVLCIQDDFQIPDVHLHVDAVSVQLRQCRSRVRRVGHQQQRQVRVDDDLVQTHVQLSVGRQQLALNAATTTD